MKIEKGFTKFNFNLRGSMYKGFAWFGWLQVILHGKSIIVSASGCPSGDDGDFDFKIGSTKLGRKFTQDEADQMKVIAFKTKNEINLFNQ